MLHISCHGVKNSPQPRQGLMGLDSGANLEEDLYYSLLFEDNLGNARLVSAQELGEFMQKTKHVMDVVFVAACDSKDIGKIFQRSGAKHVICVEKNRFVLDEAAIKFTNIFYQEVFNGTEICTAFAVAKHGVGFQITKKEAELFILLLSEPNKRDKRKGNRSKYNMKS